MSQFRPTDCRPVLFSLPVCLAGTTSLRPSRTRRARSSPTPASSARCIFLGLVVPLSAVISNLLAFALQLRHLSVFWIYFRSFTAVGASFGFSGAIVFLPLVVLQIAALSLGVGLWLSALTENTRDFVVRVASGLPDIGCTAVISPLSQVPERWRWLAVLNPMTMPVGHQVSIARTGRRRSVPLCRLSCHDGAVPCFRRARVSSTRLRDVCGCRS